MLEMRQPCYDYEETKTHTKDSRVEILESDDSLMKPPYQSWDIYFSLQEEKKHSHVLNHHYLGHVAEWWQMKQMLAIEQDFVVKQVTHWVLSITFKVATIHSTISAKEMEA